MRIYQGEFDFHLSKTEFADFKSADWAMYFIERYGQINGEHHKLWVLDQVARILKGSAVTVKEARWSDGTKEYRVTVDEPSADYEAWVTAMQDDFDYDEGVAP